jgi:hypothetical protein
VRQFRRDYDFLRGAQFVPSLTPALRRLKLENLGGDFVAWQSSCSE